MDTESKASTIKDSADIPSNSSGRGVPTESEPRPRSNGNTELEVLKKELRSILVSAATQGLPIKHLERDYVDLYGRPLSCSKYGCETVEELIDLVPDTVSLVGGLLFPVSHASTKHLENLVSEQRPSRTSRFTGPMPLEQLREKAKQNITFLLGVYGEQKLSGLNDLYRQYYGDGIQPQRNFGCPLEEAVKKYLADVVIMRKDEQTGDIWLSLPASNLPRPFENGFVHSRDAFSPAPGQLAYSRNMLIQAAGLLQPFSRPLLIPPHLMAGFPSMGYSGPMLPAAVHPFNVPPVPVSAPLHFNGPEFLQYHRNLSQEMGPRPQVQIQRNLKTDPPCYPNMKELRDHLNFTSFYLNEVIEGL